MKKEKVSQIINQIDETYIDEATVFAINRKECSTDNRISFPEKTNHQPRRIKWAAVIAACLAVVLVIGSATIAFAAEAREYKKAVAFFEDYGLSTEGLSRSEIKAVYRDITTNSFTYGKTAEVLQKAVPGWEIDQDEPTPEELAALWDRSVWRTTIRQNGISYRFDYEYTSGQEHVKKSLLECYQDGELIWTADFPNVYTNCCTHVNGNTLLWGQNEVTLSTERIYGWIACVDSAGNTMWQQWLNHDFESEYVASILPNKDGSWAVISRGDLKYLCLSCYDADGKELSFHKTEVGNYGIQNAARLGDGYIVQLWNQFSGDTALLFKMDRKGNLTDSFSYEADDCDYYITDMVEYEGQVYLSAYATPKRQGKYGTRDEIANVLDYIYSNKNWEIASEELTPVVRNNYTAVLLLCDPEGGSPRTFYSVKGSLGDSLSVSGAGQLEWHVDSVTSTFFSPATNSFTIGGICKVFSYTFDAAGNLTEQKDTGDTVPYRK